MDRAVVCVQVCVNMYRYIRSCTPIPTHKLKKENKFHISDVLPLGNLSKLYFSHRNSKNANVYKFSLKQNKSLTRKPVTLPY